MHFRADGWADALKRVLRDHQFEVDFMYGATDGQGARVVFSVVHPKNPRISPHGIASLIQRVFNYGEVRGFVPMLNVDEPSVFIACIAQIARYRVSTNPRKDAFNPYDPTLGDVGCKLAETIVEWTRYTACHLQIDSLQAELENADLRDQVRAYNLKICQIHGIPFHYDRESTKVWNSKNKTASCVSAIFQASPAISCRDGAADDFWQAKTNLRNKGDRNTALGLLLEAMKNLHQSYCGVAVQCTVKSAVNYPTALVHVLMQFPKRIQLYGAENLNKRLQHIASNIGCCSILSLMPVEFQPDNLLALAVLAMHDGKSSPARDKVWLALRNNAPATIVKATTSLPAPTRGRSETPRESGPESPSGCKTPRARSRTPAPRSRAATPSRYYAPPAKGKLLESVASLWRNEHTQDFIPGSVRFEDLFADVVLFVPEWVFSILDYAVEPPFLDEKDLASTIFGSSVIRCLKILAKAMHVCGKLLYRASHEVVLILRDALDPVERLCEHLGKALQACQGIMPVLEAFRHMKASSTPAGQIGGMPETAGPGPTILPRTVPRVIQWLPEDNPVKFIYGKMLMASIKMSEMRPDDDVYICWDRITRKAWELHQSLTEAHLQARLFQEYCA